MTCVGANYLYKITAAGVASIIAGTGAAGYNGDGMQATAAALKGPTGVSLGLLGSVLISDSGNARVRMIDGSGYIHTMIGTGSPGCSGDGGPSPNAAIGYPMGLFVDNNGNVCVADNTSGCYKVRQSTYCQPLIPTPVLGPTAPAEGLYLVEIRYPAGTPPITPAKAPGSDAET